MRGAAMRRVGALLVAGALLSAPSGSANAIARGAIVEPVTAPIVSVAPGAQLDCTTANERSDWLQFFRWRFSRPEALSCATVVAVTGFGLFGPPTFADLAGMVEGRRLTPYTPVSQTIAPSSGARLKVVTVVALPATGLLLRQTDTYVNGENHVDTKVELGNLSAVARDVVVYRTGDCFPGRDFGFGISGGRAIGCEQAVQDGLNAVPVAGPQYIRWDPKRGASHSMAGGVVDVRRAIATGAPLADSCDCSTPQDVAAALSWSLRVAPGRIKAVADRLTLSPLAGRDRTKLVARATSRNGVTRLAARLTSGGRPVRHAPIDFVMGSLTACSGVTTRNGKATCTVDGAAPEFVARYTGDVRLRPANATYTPDPLPPPSPDPPGFPACGHFDRVRAGLATGGDSHHYFLGVSTDAPPCPIVKYTAYGGAGVIGHMRGDLRATNFLGDAVPGFVVMYLDTPLGIVTGACLFVTATDTRTGEILDTYPGPDDVSCLPAVAGQKFR